MSASSDKGLQLDLLKLDLLVIAGQQTAVNTFSSLVLTARQLKGVGNTQNEHLMLATVGSMTGSKS